VNRKSISLGAAEPQRTRTSAFSPEAAVKNRSLDSVFYGRFQPQAAVTYLGVEVEEISLMPCGNLRKSLKIRLQLHQGRYWPKAAVV
jgi:hypothetical protein